MAELMVREWLADYKTLSPTEVQNFTCTTIENDDLIQAIFSVIEDKNRHQEFLEPICNQLFSFYRFQEMGRQRFALQFLPTLICVYLCSLAAGDKRTVKCIGVLLLGIYNLEVVDAAGKPLVLKFRLPSIAQPSIYHTPISLASTSLTENALSRLEKGDSQVASVGPFPQVETLNAQNRMKVMAVLMNVYNRHLSHISKPALQALCKTCSRLVKQGFGKQGVYHRTSFGSDGLVSSAYPRCMPRVHLTSKFLLEVLHAVYFATFHGLASGLQTIDEISVRASHEMMADVLLVTGSIKNSLKAHPFGVPVDGPMGINIALSPTTNATTVSKSIITNASFRTRKLPDDIPIQKDKQEDGEGKSLTTISEETEDVDKTRSVTKGKEKDKEKGVPPLMSMIAKIGEKGKSGKKTDGDQLQASTHGKLKEKLSSSSEKESRRKESIDGSATFWSNRKDSLVASGGLLGLRNVTHNGDTDIASSKSHKNSSDNVSVELKSIGSTTPKMGTTHLLQQQPSERRKSSCEMISDGGSTRGSLSSAESFLDEDKMAFHVSNHSNDLESSSSHSQIQTAV